MSSTAVGGRQSPQVGVEEGRTSVVENGSLQVFSLECVRKERRWCLGVERAGKVEEEEEEEKRGLAIAKNNVVMTRRWDGKEADVVPQCHAHRL